jgi:UDP-N-acetyl-D-glucosamine/UDP-N-acetyl-D-galactosamine dehydrogenase
MESQRAGVSHLRRIAVIGLGYVGLPVAVSFARSGIPVIGFDTDDRRIAELRAGRDRTCEIDPADLHSSSLVLTVSAEMLSEADFYIVAVPTPIDEAHCPDLAAVLSASRIVGAALKRGDIVVYESTVYPGAVEEECVPALEQASGYRAGLDFTVGYSPERINPGDRLHRFETIKKVVAGQDKKTVDVIAEVYSTVVQAGVHRAPSIKVAEAAKLLENTQRDLNIALINELSAICHRLGIDTGDVLAAAGTKWNFLPFFPGLVGGHCIGVDPYYLTHLAERTGYHPEVILAGRRINDGVGCRVARECVRLLLRAGASDATVTVLGLTYKENVPDIRNSKVGDIIGELKSFGIKVQVHDPLANPEEAARQYGINLAAREALRAADAVIVAVAHEPFVHGGWPYVTQLLKNNSGIVVDIRGHLDRASRPPGIVLWRL